MNSHKIKCPVCNNISEKIVVNSDTAPGPWSGITHLASCSKCFFKWAIPEPDKNCLDQYYLEQFRKNDSEQKGKIPFSFDKCLRGIAQMQLCRMFYDYQKDSAILDIGAGYGFTLEAAVNLNLSGKKYAIEPSKQITQYLEKKGVTVFQKIFTPVVADEIDMNFDTVVLSHALEHFCGSEVKNIIISVKSILQKNGIVLCEVPNGKCDGRRGYPGRHLSFFSVESLKMLFETAGYEVLFLNTCGDNSHASDNRDSTVKNSGSMVKKKYHLKSFLKKIPYMKKRINGLKAFLKGYPDAVFTPNFIYGGSSRRNIRIIAKPLSS